MTTQKEKSGIQAERDEILGSGADGVPESIEVAIRYPAEGDDAMRTIAIGGLLTLLSVLVIPVFILAGYFVRVLNRTAGGDEVPPVFDEWGELAVTGLQAVLIGVAYALVPMIIGGGAVAVGIGLSGDGSLASLGVAAVLLGGLLWTLLSLVVAYLLPAALVNFARERSLGAGFAFATLKPIWFSRSYALAWGTMLLVALLGGVVAGILNVVPILGQIAGVFVGFYFGVAAYSVIGRAWDGLPVVGHTSPDGMASISADDER
jgi:hypothetical protein